MRGLGGEHFAFGCTINHPEDQLNPTIIKRAQHEKDANWNIKDRTKRMNIGENVTERYCLSRLNLSKVN